MKSILILTVLFFTCLFTQAQSNNENIVDVEKANKVEMIENQEFNTITIETTNESKIEVARLYKHKNNRVIKALKFVVKSKKSKMA